MPIKPLKAPRKKKKSPETERKSRPRIAIYWASGCGGCEIAFLEIAERILEVAEKADLVFCPCLMDTKYQDLEKMPDDSIDLTLFNGAIRTSENEEMAYLLRDKSKVLVAYGSCSYEGCIPALANLCKKEDILNFAYKESPSAHNPDKVIPAEKTRIPLNGQEIELNLPCFHNYVRSLDQVVEADYYVPGCPPVRKSTDTLLDAFFSGKMPPKGSVVGAGDKSVCEDCKRERKEKKIKAFKRPHLHSIDPTECLLDQGFMCCGPATRGGCGALCPSVNMPCIGCYGPLTDVEDQGVRILSVFSSVLDYQKEDEIKKALEDIMDPAGYFNKFSMSHCMLFRNRFENIPRNK